MRTKPIFATLTATLVLAACTAENISTSGEPQNTAAIDGSSSSRPADAALITNGDAKTQAPTAAGDQRTTKVLSQDEKLLLASIDSRYFGTLTNALPGEEIDLEKLGFPDASDWIAAARSTDNELLQNARRGGHLEKELYIDRITSLIPKDNWKGVSDSAEDNILATKIMDARSFALNNIGVTKSPFAAYQAAAIFNATEIGGNPEIIAASLQLASELGDTRATRMLQSYMAANRNIDAGGVLAAYMFLKSDLRDKSRS